MNRIGITFQAFSLSFSFSNISLGLSLSVSERKRKRESAQDSLAARRSTTLTTWEFMHASAQSTRESAKEGQKAQAEGREGGGEEGRVEGEDGEEERGRLRGE